MPDFPNLTFLPIDSLLIHERHDDSRTLPLVQRIRTSGVFRNPPVVAPLNDGSERYMVLDGANRVTALRTMGFPHALVQVVQPDSPGLSLHTWNHVVWEMDARRFIRGLHALPGSNILTIDDPEAHPDLEGDCGLAVVESVEGRKYAVCAQADDLEKHVQLLNELVDSYKDRARFDRTSLRDAGHMSAIYPSFCGLVIFPSFSIQDLLRLAGQAYLLPAGVTRFLISPRALHINYPLEELAADKPLQEKNRDLDEWIKQRLAHKGVRYYAEATYLFDE
jgi:L-serine kinase (ATP) / ParB family transcriptional regulator, heme-responsive regulator